MTTHDFTASRDRIDTLDPALPWESIYRNAFPGFHGMIKHASGSCWGQAAGIDRTIILKSGAHILIDEKVRHSAYPDVLLEFLSVKERGVPGWVCTDLAADFTAYAVLPLGICYMLPVPLLRRAWEANGEAWKRRYGIKQTRNSGYTSESVAVPIKELAIALVEAMRVTFEPVNLEKAG